MDGQGDNLNNPPNPAPQPAAPAAPAQPAPNKNCTFWCDFGGPIALGAVVIGAAIFFSMWCPSWMASKGQVANDWAGLLLPEMTNHLDMKFPAATTNEQVRLQSQVQFISNRAHAHFSMMEFFYLNYYTQLMLKPIFAAFAAIALVLITKKGWDQSNHYLISFFLTASVCAAFFLAFPEICKMDENVTKNKALCKSYVALLNDARTFAATTNYVQDPPTNAVSSAEFIMRQDGEMKRLNDISVAFDASKTPDYSKLNPGKPSE